MIEQAQHWYAAHDTVEALVSCWRASMPTGRALAYAEQLTLLGRVLELWDKVPDAEQRIGVSHLSVLEMSARVAGMDGDNDRSAAFATAALNEVDPAAEPARAALLLETRALARRYGSSTADLRADLQAALDLVPPGVADAARARVLFSMARHVLPPYGPEPAAALEEALRLARRAGHLATEAAALHGLAEFVSRDGDDQAALEMLRQARAIAASAEDYGLARSSGTFLAINVAEPLAALGRWDEAAEVIEHALALSPTRPANRVGLRQLAGELALRRGDLAAAADSAALGRAALANIGHGRLGQYSIPLARLDIELLLAEGKPADALGGADDAVGRIDLALDPRFAWALLAVAATVAGAAVRVRRTSAALAGRGADLPRRLHPLAGTLPGPGPVQQADRLTFRAEALRAAAAAPGDETPAAQILAAFDAAAAAWEGDGQPYPLAVALLHGAEAALAASDRDGAAARLRRGGALPRGRRAPARGQ